MEFKREISAMFLQSIKLCDGIYIFFVELYVEQHKSLDLKY